MNKVAIKSDAWTAVSSAASTDVLIQCPSGCVIATGTTTPSVAYGIAIAPFERVIVPSGLSVYARTSGETSGEVIVAVFGAA